MTDDELTPRRAALLQQYEDSQDKKDSRGLVVVLGGLAAFAAAAYFSGNWDAALPVGPVLGAIGAIFLVPGLHKLWLQWRSQSWIEQECVIEFTTARHISRGLYQPIVGFSYQVDGTEHLGFTPHTSALSVPRQVADQTVERFVIGERRVCYVDPGNQGRAVLERDWRFGAVVIDVLLGVGLWLLGWVVLRAS